MNLSPSLSLSPPPPLSLSAEEIVSHLHIYEFLSLSPSLFAEEIVSHLHIYESLSHTHSPPPPPPPQPGFQSIYMIMENGFKYFRFQLICRIKKTRIDSTFTMWRVLENIFMFKCFSNGISSSQSGTFSYIIVVYQNIGRYYGILRPRPHFPHKRTWYKQ